MKNFIGKQDVGDGSQCKRRMAVSHCVQYLIGEDL